jgi:hypothetical protein
MSAKLTTAAANIRATAQRGLRTGHSYFGNPAPAPVTVWCGPGPTSLPHTLDKLAPVQHPEPLPDPVLAKRVAAAQAAQSRQLANQRRRNQRAARKAATVAAQPAAPAKAATLLPMLRKLPKGRFAGTFARNLCRTLAAGAPHSVKVVEAKADINGGPAWLVYLKLEGQARGKHVITLYRNAVAAGT